LPPTRRLAGAANLVAPVRQVALLRLENVATPQALRRVRACQSCRTDPFHRRSEDGVFVKAGCGKTARPVCAADGGQRESNRARLLRPDSCEADEQSEESPLRRRLRGRSQRCRWSEGRGPRGIRTSTARTGLRTRLACHRRWSVYGNLCRHTPEARAVCGKAASTDLGGGRAMKRTSLPLRKREFIAGFGGAVAWPFAARAQQSAKLPTIGF